MSEVPCCHCGELFPSSPRHKNQRFCGKPECQRARKAAWQRHKIQTDPDYRFNQKLSQKQWAKTILATGRNTAKDILTKQKETVSFKPSVTAGPGHSHLMKR